MVEDLEKCATTCEHGLVNYINGTEPMKRDTGLDSVHPRRVSAPDDILTCWAP
jgi:hypothetical protein